MHALISWFARNSVAANLFMVLILAAGTYFGFATIPLEYFPESEPDRINISMAFRGASPEEVEEGVTTRIEQAIAGLNGIREITSSSSEGSASVNVEIEKGRNARELYDEIKNRVDSISTFPPDTERPEISLDQRMSRVITVVVAADMSLHDLRKLGEQVRDEIAALPGVTIADLRGVRPYEISIEVSEQNLQRYGLTIAEVSAAVQRSSLDLPAGGLKTSSGEVLLRTKGQAYNKEQFEKIVVKAEPDGARVLLNQVAEVRDEFNEEPYYSVFNGKPCVFVQIDKGGAQNMIELAETVKEYLKTANRHLPDGVTLNYWRDNSEPVKARLSYLFQNCLWAALLVFLVLALFLRLSLAFWVCMGIPVAFAGGLIVMHYCNVTINMFSLFGFIVVLGIVVDDAIVVGESVFTRWKSTRDNTEAAVLGTLDVSMPVTFGVLTTVTAFLPLLYLTGWGSSFFQQIPMVVVPVLLASLLETKTILPSHLAHLKRLPDDPAQISWFTRKQQALANWLQNVLAHNLYRRVLGFVLKHRYASAAAFVSVLLVAGGILLGGHMRYEFMPRFYLPTVSAQLEMPLGTPAHVTEKHLEKILAAAHQLKEKFRDPKTGKSVVRHVMHVMGNTSSRGGFGNSGSSHQCEVTLELPPYEERTIESGVITQQWRELIGEIPGARELRFRDSFGGDSDPIDIRIDGQNFEEMLAVSEKLQAKLRTYNHVYDVRDTFSYGKQEIQIKRIKPEAEAQGLTKEMVARQLRQAFYGDEAQRIQRGRDDVRVMVRYPPRERKSLDYLERMKLRTPSGAEIPFSSAVEISYGRSPTTIRRVDRNRSIAVLADVDAEKVDLVGVRRELNDYLLQLKREHGQIFFAWQGQMRDLDETTHRVTLGVLFVLLALYTLMAIPFKSYLLPLIVLAVLPFGTLGALLGHFIKGINLSIFSVLGMLTLAGIMVNESLVLIDFINKKRDEGMSTVEAARLAGVDRFRPILLTNLTTFTGFVPLIFESSTKESFLSQMSVSLAFGVMFSFFVTLLLVPINYLILHDLKNWLKHHTTATARARVAWPLGLGLLGILAYWICGVGTSSKSPELRAFVENARNALTWFIGTAAVLLIISLYYSISRGEIRFKTNGTNPADGAAPQPSA